MASYQTSSSEETKQLGKELAELLLREKPDDMEREGAFVVALSGDLGAGKTTFTQGFFEGLGVKERATSPTFIIMRRHALPTPPKKKNIFSTVFHVDAYRLKDPSELITLGFAELLADPKNIFLIEWPEQVGDLVPDDAVLLNFSYGEKENERTITIAEK
jgi:tRNA threonylcarbamoyladenosine biosynthesis protein TsaE